MRKRSSIFRLAALLFVIGVGVLPGGCLRLRPVLPLDGTRWILVSYQGEQGKVVMPPAVAKAGLEFQRRKFQGSTGCNSMRGDYAVREGNRLVIENVITTSLYCLDPSVREQEEGIMRALHEAKSFTLEGGELQLLDAWGRTLAVFNPAER